MPSIQQALIFGLMTALAAQVLGTAIMPRSGGVGLSVDQGYGNCGTTTCAEETCLVSVKNLYGCNGEYSGYGANGEVAGTCQGVLKGESNPIPIDCGSGVSLSFCQKDGKDYVVFKNSDGPSSGRMVYDSDAATWDSIDFDTGADYC